MRISPTIGEARRPSPSPHTTNRTVQSDVKPHNTAQYKGQRGTRDVAGGSKGLRRWRAVCARDRVSVRIEVAPKSRRRAAVLHPNCISVPSSSVLSGALAYRRARRAAGRPPCSRGKPVALMRSSPLILTRGSVWIVVGVDGRALLT